MNCTVFQLRRGEVGTARALCAWNVLASSPTTELEVTEASVNDDEAARICRDNPVGNSKLSLDDIASDGSVHDNLKDRDRQHDKDRLRFGSGPRRPRWAKSGHSRSIVKLCFSLGISTVAEAVETAEQVTFLREVGAGAAQGYFFSDPLLPTKHTHLRR